MPLITQLMARSAEDGWQTLGAATVRSSMHSVVIIPDDDLERHRVFSILRFHIAGGGCQFAASQGLLQER